MSDHSCYICFANISKFRMKHRVLISTAGLLATLAFALPSCQKDTDCKAVVTCLDSAGRPVNGANVFLYAPVKSADGKTTYTADITATGTSDADGRSEFTFRLPAIYDVKGTAQLGGKNITGTGVVKLEEGQTVEKTITLR
jgi:hypothetical protein